MPCSARSTYYSQAPTWTGDHSGDRSTHDPSTEQQVAINVRRMSHVSVSPSGDQYSKGSESYSRLRDADLGNPFAQFDSGCGTWCDAGVMAALRFWPVPCLLVISVAVPFLINGSD